MSTATRPAVGGRSRDVAASPRPLRNATPGLRVVPAPPPAPRRAPFVALVLTMLVLGLGALLVLNTVLAQGAFRVHDLESEVAALTDQEQALQQQVSGLAAPVRLMQRARALGMVPMAGPAFLRTSDGAILGRPAPAPGAPAGWVSTSPPVTPTPAATPTPAPTTEKKADPKSDPKADQKNGQANDRKNGQKGDAPANPDATTTGAGR